MLFEITMLAIYIDADACPVKQEVYKVAERYQLEVFVVSNSQLYTPKIHRIHSIIVGATDDAADHWIAEHIGKDDICITADIPLAARCLAVEASVLDPRGQPFSAESIGEMLASRNLLFALREAGMIDEGGPRPLLPKNRSQFLNQLDQIIQKILRHNPPT